MEGFDLIAWYKVDESVVHGGHAIVVSKLEYYRQ
jgi:hypothetical protein